MVWLWLLWWQWWQWFSGVIGGPQPLPALPIERQRASDSESESEGENVAPCVEDAVDGAEATDVDDEIGGQQDQTQAPLTFGELRLQLESADEAGILEILQSHLNSSQFSAYKEAITDKALFKACENGNGYAQVVKWLLDMGRNANTPFHSSGVMPLNLASSNGHIEVTRRLLDAHADVNKADPYGTPLYCAAERGQTEVVRLLLAASADVNTPNPDERTPLYSAAEGGHVGVVRLLLDAHADTTIPDKYGMAPLPCAADGGHIEVVRLLLADHADVNTPDPFGWTPLHRAAGRGKPDVVRLLLAAHADVATTCKDGSTPIYRAAEGGHTEVVRLLLDARADVNTANKIGETPLGEAAVRGHMEIVRLLVEAHVDVNTADQAGETPLHLAKTSGVAQCLLAAGADPHARSKDGHDAVNFALLRMWLGGCSMDALRTLQMLVEYGSEWDSTCDKIADREALWPSSMRYKPGKSQSEQWRQQAPAVRVCVERWADEHKQGLPFTDIPVEQVRNGVEATQIFIQEIAASRDVKFRRKICVVGPSNWGKTSLVKSLTTETPSLVHPDDRTIGIDHFHLAFKEEVHELKATKKHEVTFWDFAGQDAYQVAHSLFFSDRTIYIVCIDLESYVTARMQADLMTDTESESDRWMNEFIDTRVLRWIRVICARQQDAEFVFVATKRDRVINANLDGEDGALADLRKRMENVAVIVQEMKKELEKKTADRHQSSTTKDATEPPAHLPITHLGDLRLSKMSTKPSVRIIVTTCVTSEDVHAFKVEIQDVIKKSNRSFPMPDKFSLVLEALLQMRAEAIATAIDTRMARTFTNVDELVQLLADTVTEPVKDDAQKRSADEQESYLDKHTCRRILQTLRDLGDVLWYDTIDDELLRRTVILDPRLMIDLVRDVFDHNHTDEIMTHHTLKGLKYWRHLDGTASMLSMKRVLHHFHLVYPTTGEMLVDSDLIVPAYWKTNTCAFWMFGGGDLRFGRGVHREDVVVRVHFEFQFVNNYPDTLFDHVVVASYSPFLKRDVGPDWIMYMDKEVYACRLMVGRDQETHHPMLHLEALQGHSADEEDVENLWETFTLILESLEKVIHGYPGVVVTRYVREDTEKEVTTPRRYTFETLGRFKLTRASRKWMPPQQTWESCLEFCKK